MHRLEFMRGELARARQMRANKVFLGCFLFLAIVTFLARFTIAVLLDFGLKDGQFYPDWWKTIISGEQTAAGGPNLEDPYWRQLFDRRPNFLWMMTQFTWLTTLLMIFYLFFRFFGVNRDLPEWLRWIGSQRTLSIVTIYEITIALIYWFSYLSGVRIEVSGARIPVWSFLVTLVVHAFLPFFVTFYSVIFLIQDKSASLLRERFVFKAMTWPIIYAFYYILVALVWKDPYAITDFKGEFYLSLGKMIGALLTIYFLIGVMVIVHNYILVRFNHKYLASHDNDALLHRKQVLARIKTKAARKVMKDDKIRDQLNQLTHEIIQFEREVEIKKRIARHKWKIARRNSRKNPFEQTEPPS
ncbi:hypothetical protein [Mycoplasma sp. ATU-Cv-703]|uniref:hypothetical protein n=2 Tax=unclassified Mycoplasma TaxID=2683645 RepID=UPI000FDE3802